MKNKSMPGLERPHNLVARLPAEWSSNEKLLYKQVSIAQVYQSYPDF
ncbi:MAG TPA: hypothetical protein VLH15_10845 [Dehalococcoidales bacterium]|nr:hypothetical protein [Dehalococcoidales bacterium]